MKKIAKLLVLGLFVVILVVGCSGPQEKEESKSPEQIAQEKYEAFEKQAVNVAKEFVVATAGDKETIKELSFPSLLKEIEEKNWSIMLVDEIKINPDTFDATTEKLGDKQVLVRVFYEGEMKVDDKVIPVKLSNKIGIIEQDGQPKVFSVE